MSEAARYLLDTNLLSETKKKQPEGKVLQFLRDSDPLGLYVSVLTLGELRKGATMKERSDPARGRALHAWIDLTESSFGERVLGVNSAVASLWGLLSAERSLPVVDTLLAATAIYYGLTLVSRNVKDFTGAPVDVVNPWGDPLVP